MSAASPARTAVTALVIGIALILVLFALGAGPQLLVGLGLLVLAPGAWWRWKTREFRRGVRRLRRGDADAAAERFNTFLAAVDEDPSFLRFQPFFNLGRPYDYVAAAHNNLGVLALRRGERVTAGREFDAAVARNPNFAPGHYGRAAVHLLAEDPGAAAAAASEGLEAEPGHRPCTLMLALARAEAGEPDAARAALGQLKKPPSWDEARSLWAKMYRFWGEPGRAGHWE